MRPASLPVTREAIRDAARRIEGHARRTPLLTLGSLCGANVQLKLELVQHSGSFKVRGAFNNLLSKPIPKAGVAAASGGNHGAAVAYAARQLGVNARIFVPVISSAAKVAAIKASGAEIVVGGERYADAQEACDRYVEQSGALS